MSKKRKKRNQGANSLSPQGDNRQQKKAKFAGNSAKNNKPVQSPVGTNTEEAESVLSDMPQVEIIQSSPEKSEKDSIPPNKDNVVPDNAELQSDNDNAVIQQDEDIQQTQDDNLQENSGPKKEKDDKTDKSNKSQNADRLKKAAYIKKMNEDIVSVNRLTAYESDTPPDNALMFPADIETADTPTAPQFQHPPLVSEYKSLSPEAAKLMKKAAYIKQMNEYQIQMSRAAALSEGEIITQSALVDSNYETELIPAKPITPNKTLPTENGILTDDKKILAKNAYAEQIKKKQFSLRKIGDMANAHINDALGEDHSEKSNKPQENKVKYNIGDGVVEAAESAADVVSAIQSGDAKRVVSIPVKYIVNKHISEKTSKTAAGITAAAAAVKNSDSVGSTVTNVGTAFAASAAKRYISDTVKGRKKYRFLDNRKKQSYSDKYKKDGLAARRISKIKEAIQQKKKNVFLKHNSETLSFSAKINFHKVMIKKKIRKMLLAFSSGFLIPLFVIIILVVIVCSLFSWLAPFDFSLSGDDSGNITTAETEAEVIDGYTLLIQNYMDVAQAYYYLEYGDWYGGTYDYPGAATEISYGDFLSQKCEKVIRDIQTQFENAIANAQSPQEAAAIASAMEQAISAALRQAQEQAMEEYTALIEGLDDNMTAEERRQHYEVFNNGGSNGTEDSAEFSGKPIVGTNLFGNVEIQSDLSAEELLAMTALYKSLKLAQSGGTTDDGSEYNYNITPEDIMMFFEKTEYIPITTKVTHNNPCTEQNCKRRIVGSYDEGYSWEYYCDSDHDNLSGQIEPCISKDDLLAKIIELTEGEENGFDTDTCNDLIDDYIKYFCDELDIDESGYRQFGSNDSERAKDFYEKLIDPAEGEIPNNFWEVNTPIDGESEDSTDE